MSKLELKHLAGYAPYGLCVICGGAERNLSAISLDSRFVFITLWKGSREKQMEVIDNIKPILHPLSDLAKPCLPDERTPAEEMEDDLMMSWCVAYDEAYEIITENEETLKSKVKMLPYDMVEWLFKHHFDIYGLVDQNLAVDINTLPK